MKFKKKKTEIFVKLEFLLKKIIFSLDKPFFNKNFIFRKKLTNSATNLTKFKY